MSPNTAICTLGSKIIPSGGQLDEMTSFKDSPNPGFCDQKPISKPLSLKTHMALSLEKMTTELVSYCPCKDMKSQINLVLQQPHAAAAPPPPAKVGHSGICTLRGDPGVWHD